MSGSVHNVNGSLTGERGTRQRASMLRPDLRKSLDVVVKRVLAYEITEEEYLVAVAAIFKEQGL